MGGTYYCSQSLQANPYVVVFDGSLLREPPRTTGRFLLLTFDISENASAGDYPVRVSFTDGGAPVDVNLAELGGTASDGVVCVLPAGVSAGDVNGNGRVNIVDAQCAYDLCRGRYGASYERFPLPSGWTTNTLICVANINGDDGIDAADAFAIQRYVHYLSWD